MSQPPQSTRRVDAGRIKGAAPCASVIEVQIMCTGANGKSANFACYGSYTTAPASMATLASALWTAISSAWSSNLASLMAPTASINAVHVRDMTAVTNPVFVGSTTSIAGTGTPPALPPENCIVLTENIQQRGKGLKGRMYLSGWVAAADSGTGVIAAAAETAANNFGAAVFAALQANSLTPCIAQVARQAYIGFTGTSHVARPMGHPAVGNYLVRNTTWDSQRRRGQP